MYQLATIPDELLHKLIQINREEGTFRLKINIHPGPGPDEGRHWLLLYFQAPVNCTIPGDDERIVHQNWELIETVGATDSETGKELWLYRFEFMGFYEHDTLQYNGRELGISAAAFHKILKEEADANPALVPELNDTIGLEHIRFTRLPNQPGFFLQLLVSAHEADTTCNHRDSLKNLRFHSSNHIRYQNGIVVSGNNKGCNRGIEVDGKTEGEYKVTIHNLDGVHPVWGNNIQMAPKRMRIVKETSNMIELKGYGYDAYGTPYSDYGMTFHFSGSEVERIVLHLHDRQVDIEYLK